MGKKIKKKIPHKIIWDRAADVPASVPRTRTISSPHVLDLRSHHTAVIRPSNVFVGWCSRWSQYILNQLRVVRVRKSKRSSGIRLPSLSGSALHEQYPWLGSVMVGTLFVSVIAGIAWLLQRPSDVVASTARNMTRIAHGSLHAHRTLRGTMRYWMRRMRLALELWLPESMTRVFRRPSWLPILSTRQRMVAVFACLAFIIVLPVHVISSAGLPSFDTLTADGRAMIHDMTRALEAMEEGRWQDAESVWSSLERQSTLLGETTYLTNPLVGGVGSMVSDQIRTGRALLTALHAAASMGRTFSIIGTIADAPLSVAERLERVRSPFREATGRLTVIADSMEEVNALLLPASIADAISVIRERLPFATEAFGRFSRMLDPLSVALGNDRPMRYLLLFQNDSELRPTGGFIGSIAVIDVRDGRITNTFVPTGGSYDLQGSLRVNVQSPLPLQHVNARWEFQDANWWPDFPTSAKKLLWFWDEAGGPTVDGIIAVNASLVERLLALVGPIEVPAFGVTVTAENFFDVTQRAVEFEYDHTANTPKLFIADLLESLLSRIDAEGRGISAPMILALLDAVERRDLMLMMRQPALAAAVAAAGMDGAMPALQPFEDGLLVVHTNIGGEKTDRVTSDAIRHETRVDDATGALINTVTLTRAHRGIEGQMFTGGRNRDYVRFYVPAGSELMGAEGFMLPTRPREVPLEEYTMDADLRALAMAPERSDRAVVYDDLGRTVIGGWLELDSGQVHTVQITYRLPWTVIDAPEYRVRVDRQSGYRRATIEHSVDALKPWSVVRRTPVRQSGPLPLDRAYQFSETFERL